MVIGRFSIYCSFVFFFKQKTAYEMRISDWSSDVCSSDLGWLAVQRICRAMLDEVAEIANTVTASIRTAQPVYSVIPEIAHRAAVEVQVRNKLRALSEQIGRAHG